jgi:hypothetical protein
MRVALVTHSSWAGLSGHPRLPCLFDAKTWMPGMKPGMTKKRLIPTPSNLGYDSPILAHQRARS